MKGKSFYRLIGLALAVALLSMLALPAEAFAAAGTKSEIDTAQAASGIIRVRYLNATSLKLKVQIRIGDEIKATHNLNGNGEFESYGLTWGSGDYIIKVLENISGNQYAVVQTETVTVGGSSASATPGTSAPGPSSSSGASLKDDPAFAPYLTSNSTVVYNSNSAAVKKAAELVADAKDDFDKVTKVYSYIINNVSYDYDKAKQIQQGIIKAPYTPSVDGTLSAKKGICYDYAAVLAAMLRSQGIPTKLVKGYVGEVYHAWNEVYISGTGWVKVGVSFAFDGKKYTGMDSTYSAADKKYEFKSSSYRTTSTV